MAELKTAPKTGNVQEGVIGPELEGSLVDTAVRSLFQLSWNRARDLVRRGKVSVNGETITSGTKRVYLGATLVLDIAARDARAAKETLEKDAIVFLDGHIVVVEKPAGVSTVPFDPDGMGASIAMRRRPGEEATLDQRVRAALAKRDKSRGRSGPPPEIGVVHRLDKETSGLLVFTRSWQAKKALTDDFRGHRVHRRYLALVHGTPRSGTIETHLIEDRGDGLRGSVEHRRGRQKAIGSERTQRAVTHIEVLERFDHASLVGITLETGRTHQIRIHLSEEGHPLIGERVYTRGWAGMVIPAPRIMLHAAELGFMHPANREDTEAGEVDDEGGSQGERQAGTSGLIVQTGQPMKWTSEPPPDFAEMSRFLRGS